MATSTHRSFPMAGLAASLTLATLTALAIGCGGRAATSTGPPPGSVTPGAADDASAGVAQGGDGGADDPGGDRNFSHDAGWVNLPVTTSIDGPGHDLDPGVLVAGACPADVPLAYAPCTTLGVRCSYGSSHAPDIRCRGWAECKDTGWSLERPANAPCGDWNVPCDGPDPEWLKSCNGACSYSSGLVCHCGPVSIDCYVPTKDKNCPPFLPNQGTACKAHATCTYGAEGGDCLADVAYAACEGGVWILAPSACRD